jgi:hypothetical protein
MVSVTVMDSVWVMVCVWAMPVASVQVSVSEMDWCIVLFSVIVSIMVMDSVRAVEVRFVVRIRQRRSERLSICFDFRNSI